MRRLLPSLVFLLCLSLPAGGFAADQQALLSPSHAALFGSREVFSPDNSAFFKWNGMLRRYAAERHATACAPGFSRDCVPAEWRALAESLKGLGLWAKVEAANAAINRHPYVPSWVNWHESNHWETPFEFLRKGGQCQDYAIAKYLLLRAAGVPKDSLRVVVVRDTKLGLDHAVTVAYVEGEALILDNLRRTVVPASSIREYQPYYSINEEGWWLHRGPNARYAALH
jgi:predicted transglutaminase-like cysteine proteinase